MNKRFFLLISPLIIVSLLLTNCGPVTAVPPTEKPSFGDASQPTVVEDVTTPPPVQVEIGKVAPYIVGQNPPEGQRLDLSPTIEFTFDREMDQTKTAEAFTLRVSDNRPVRGKIAWLDPKTFSFKPDSRLEPSTVYKATFSASAVALDGQSLKDDVRLDLSTIDSLAVGQVFPIDKSEEIDPATNITVIFNHPVVPLQIKEEQKDLPQPLAFSPEVEGHGEWVNSSVYVFQPEQGLLSGTNYKVRVAAGLMETNGESLERSYSWNFSTRPPLIGSFALKNGEQNPPETMENLRLDQAFVVTFLQPMDEQSVREAVT